MQEISCMAGVILCFIFFIYELFSCFFVLPLNRFRNVRYKDEQIVLSRLYKGNSKEKILVILGPGYHVTLTDDNIVRKVDPFLVLPKKIGKMIAKRYPYEILAMFYTCETEGLSKAGKKLTKFINENYPDYRIIMVGHSKCGVDFFNNCKWLEVNGKNAKITSISAPFGGVNSDEHNLERLKNLILKAIYKMIIIPRNTNNDITKGSKFFKEEVDYSGLKNRNYRIIKSIIPQENKFFYYLDKKLGTYGDLVVGFEEQCFLNGNYQKERVVHATHMSSFEKGVKLLLDEGWFEFH